MLLLLLLFMVLPSISSLQIVRYFHKFRPSTYEIPHRRIRYTSTAIKNTEIDNARGSIGLSLSQTLERRSLSCLDLFQVLQALQSNTATGYARELISSNLMDTVSSNSILRTRNHTTATHTYSIVEELSNILAFLPLQKGLTDNLWTVLRMIEFNKSPGPGRTDLAGFSLDLSAIHDLHLFLEQSMDKGTIPKNLFDTISSKLFVPQELLCVFEDSFELANTVTTIESKSEGSLDDYVLSGKKYPILQQLRSKATTLKASILQTLNKMLQSPDIKEKMADQGYTEIDGRYCLMLRNTFKKGVGIVHGSSNTGRSIYVEPMEIVERTNELKTVQAEIKTEESKIYYEMCKTISTHRMTIRQGAVAVAELDIYCSRAKLGAQLNGVIPEVRNEGVVRCVNARHPVLLLRQNQQQKSQQQQTTATQIKPTSTANIHNNIVGNSIELNSTSSSLVISGPNAGGKTIVLKTCGLFALMVQFGIPIPANRGARVDIFSQVMADIGDLQSVDGDLSTFSGHLVMCREMLHAIARGMQKNRQESSDVDNLESLVDEDVVDPHFLVLLDEIGTGTDPSQGAALAQAILEELVNAGRTRVIVTTHYQRIKELALADTRFKIAAMEFVDNRPTYRLRMGAVGESYAIEAARRMQLPNNVLNRADVLLDDESRRLIALQQKLEEETEKARQLQIQLQHEASLLLQQKKSAEDSQRQLELEIKQLREGQTEQYLKDLKARERQLELLLRQAEEMVLPPTSGSIPDSTWLDKDSRSKALEKIRLTVREERVTTETEIIANEVASSTVDADILPNGEPIEIGTVLVVLEKGNLQGSRGIVTQRNKGRGRVVLKIGGVEIKMDRHVLGKPRNKVGSILAAGILQSGNTDGNKELTAKEKRLLKMLSEDLVDPDKLLSGASNKRQK